MIFRAFSRFVPLVLLVTLARAGLSQPLPDRFPISGLAVDGAGKPLSGVVVTLRRQDDSGAYVFWGAETASDARGAFRFGLAETGRYYLSAEVPGFAPISNQTLIWNTGSRALRLRFERLVTLKLQLFAPAAPNASSEVPPAAPLANSAVWVRLRSDGAAGQTTRRALTDGDGRLSIENLLPGNYSLYLSTPRGFAIQNSVTLRSEASLRLNLQAGGSLRVNVAQKGEPQRFLGGALLNLMAADPLESTRLMGDLADPGENFGFLAASGEDSELVSRDGDGTIELSHLPPGNYLARVRLAGYVASQPQPITIQTGQTASIALEALPAQEEMASLSLHLRQRNASNRDDSTKNEAARGEFSLRLLPIMANGALASDESPDSIAFLPGGNPARRARADASGQVTLFPVKVGRYRVFVSPRVPANHADDDGSAQQNSTESASIDIDVPSYGATATLVLPETGASP
ncbi:MSCRAMM family protein [Abditibacterium utsteinense]|nr:carboxypeptidase regulatory-like domain-containing protein [Abditibacterium utsteinense]